MSINNFVIYKNIMPLAESINDSIIIFDRLGMSINEFVSVLTRYPVSIKYIWKLFNRHIKSIIEITMIRFDHMTNENVTLRHSEQMIHSIIAHEGRLKKIT